MKTSDDTEKTSHFIYSMVFFLLKVMLRLLPAKQTRVQVAENPPESLVYALVDSTVKRCHQWGCRYIYGRPVIELTLSEAKDLGYHPCKSCMSDASKFYVR